MPTQLYREFDLWKTLNVLWKKAWIIILGTGLSGAIALGITYYFMTPLYTASIKLYVNNSTELAVQITDSDMKASQSLIKTYMTIIQSDTVLEKVITTLGLPPSNEQTKKIREMVSTNTIYDTEVFAVSVTAANPDEAAQIANTIAGIVPNYIGEIVQGSSVKVVDMAKAPTEKASPSLALHTLIGLMLGLVLSISGILLTELLDRRIETESDLERMFKLPVLGSITDFEHVSKHGYASYNYELSHQEGVQI
ncbi:lipopolysaccharide biosynthesis protein [Syntrophobotulus glycolicus DSM 8271]|uniref:Lipopolysaccharide biosynthesis protein n=1 Tax=Syntrophobotulus glycolicus (strain DSM 8271 / FlGlyR) TaxID=645991 RepID=F0SX23_SYNGF|nr:Wzz/FepE/Etk N-terminal domain-containing protein [Syntrophobotulus glycolicus]ADY55806.1 lipopolysaccharide biosynthesis protein [Syntrophobotulus glycolicus DSM 8271]